MADKHYENIFDTKIAEICWSEFSRLMTDTIKYPKLFTAV